MKDSVVAEIKRASSSQGYIKINHGMMKPGESFDVVLAVHKARGLVFINIYLFPKNSRHSVNNEEWWLQLRDSEVAPELHGKIVGMRDGEGGVASKEDISEIVEAILLYVEKNLLVDNVLRSLLKSKSWPVYAVAEPEMREWALESH